MQIAEGPGRAWATTRVGVQHDANQRPWSKRRVPVGRGEGVVDHVDIGPVRRDSRRSVVAVITRPLDGPWDGPAGPAIARFGEPDAWGGRGAAHIGHHDAVVGTGPG